MLTVHLSSGAQLGYDLAPAAERDVIGALRTFWFTPEDLTGPAELVLSSAVGDTAYVPMAHVVAVETEPEGAG